MKEKWIFFGVFLDEESKKEILEKVRELTIIPDNWKIFCHHMTLVFNDGKKNIDTTQYETRLGEEVELKIISIGKSSEAIAFEVDFKSANKRSHITIACAPGIPPVKSNYITRWESIEEFSVKGTIDVVRPK